MSDRYYFVEECLRIGSGSVPFIWTSQLEHYYFETVIFPSPLQGLLLRLFIILALIQVQHKV